MSKKSTNKFIIHFQRPLARPFIFTGESLEKVCEDIISSPFNKKLAKLNGALFKTCRLGCVCGLESSNETPDLNVEQVKYERNRIAWDSKGEHLERIDGSYKGHCIKLFCSRCDHTLYEVVVYPVKNK